MLGHDVQVVRPGVQHVHSLGVSQPCMADGLILAVEYFGGNEGAAELVGVGEVKQLIRCISHNGLVTMRV